MSNPAIRGRGVVYGANGQLVAGLATVWTGANSTHSASASVQDAVLEIKDSQGKVATLVNVEDILDVEFTLIPGGTAATIANAVTQSALIRKNDLLVTTLFAVADYNNAKWRIMECSSKITSENVLELTIKARKNEADFSAAPLSS